MNVFGREISFKIGAKKQESIPQAAASRSNANQGGDFKHIIDAITKQYKDRSRKDIQKWRTAIQMSEHIDKPRLNFYHDLIDDLLTDGNLYAQIQLRKYATLNTEFSVVDDSGNTNDQATFLLRQQWFYDFIESAIDSILKGTRVIEFVGFNNEKIAFKTIPSRNTVPSIKTIFPDLGKDEGVRYDDPYYMDWVMQIGSDTNLGVINNVVPNLIWVRNTLQTWSEFCEKFGLPMVAAYTNKSDKETIDKIDYMLGQMASAARGVFPEGSRIEFKEANRTDAYQVFDKFIDRNMKVVSQAIVGGTMITADGSSLSQSQVHERNLDEKIAASDKRWIEFLVNDYLFPLLRAHGYNYIGDDHRFEFSKSNNLDLTQYWAITQGVMQTHDIDPDWISKTFGIPLLGKKKMTFPSPPQAQTLNLPMAVMRYPDYPNGSCCEKHNVFAASDRFKTRMNDYTSQIMQLVWDDDDTITPEARMMALESMELIQGFKEGIQAGNLRIQYGTPDALALQMMEFNVFEFTASKVEARLAAMSNLIMDKEKFQIRSFSDFKNEASKINNEFNENWLRTEYNLSVAVGQNSAQYMRFMAEKDSVTSYVEYQTAGDDKVRGSHQLLNGRVFSLNDKAAMDLWPPNGYGCRCEMLQYVGPKTKNASGDASKALLGSDFLNSQFNINRGDIKQVFTKKQFYSDVKGLNTKLSKMTYDKVYNMPSYASLKDDLSPLKLDESITGDNVAELFKPIGKKGKEPIMGFDDYLKRKLILTEKTFSKHTKGKYLNENENRHQLFPHVMDVLNKPDEVWLHEYDNEHNTFQLRYISFFENVALIIDASIENEALQINTWYDMKVDEADIRLGLLIHKKSEE